MQTGGLTIADSDTLSAPSLMQLSPYAQVLRAEVVDALRFQGYTITGNTFHLATSDKTEIRNLHSRARAERINKCIGFSDDVVTAMADNFEVVNSKARSSGQFDDQKVLFRQNRLNVGELEMRNDSEDHYGEVRFNMSKPRCVALLDSASFEERKWSDEVCLYGHAIKTFGNWS